MFEVESLKIYNSPQIPILMVQIMKLLILALIGYGNSMVMQIIMMPGFS